MKGFRSPILGALVALACTPSMEVARREEDVHHLFLRSVSMHAPDLDLEETVKLLLADARAAQLVGGSYEHEARGIADDFEAWANGGRRPILLRDEAVAGEWRARLLFDGPGAYITELYSPASEPYRGAESWATYRIPTRAAAWERAVKEAKERDLAEQVARLSAVMGRDVRPEVDALMKSPTDIGEDWRKLRAASSAAAREMGLESPVLVGDAEAGPVTPMEELSADEFAARFGPVDEHGRLRGVIKGINLRIKVDADVVTVDDGAAEQGMREAHARADAAFVGNADAFMRRHGVRDDLVKQPADLSPEARAKREAWFASVLGGSKASAPSGSAWSPEDMATRLGPAKMQALREYFAEHPDAKVAVVGIDHGREVLSTIRDDAGRALAHVAMPAGRPLTMDDISPARPVYQQKLEPAPRPDWPPRYSAKPKPARPPKGPEVRAQQRERKAGRTAAKKRRGWP